MKKNTKLAIGVGIGFLVGALTIIAAHFFTIKQTSVHYHANFGLFMNGKRDEFKNFTFYEEVASCGGNEVMNPKIRMHMHDNKNYVVHVHDAGATWGHFFANLGYTLGDSVLKTDDSLFVDGQNSKKLTFLVNGKPVQTLANKTIGDEDVVLISYGNEDDAALQKQFKSITQDAKKFDETADPAACSGTKPFSFWDKLQQSVWSKSNTADQNH